jgi:metal-responsive CopG/Arc/MetJ family transcriptional regulator
MNDEVKGFTTVSISDNLIDRIDDIFSRAGFGTRGGYINSRLRSIVEKDELRYGGETDEKDGKQHSGDSK